MVSSVQEGLGLMNRKPIVILSEEGEDVYSTFSLEGESIFVYPLSQLETIRKIEMDLLIIDCGYNPHKGINLLKEIKTRRPDIPVVFLTEESSEEIAIKTFKAGAREFFKKPVNFDEFKKRLNDILILKRRAKERRYPFSDLEISKLFDSLETHMPENIFRVIYFLNEHLDQKLSILDMAREAGLSRFHFCRTFKKYTGKSPKKFLCMMRLEKAKRLLQDSGKSVSEISVEVGFDDLSNFIRYFKKYTGVTPSRYRKEVLNIE